MCNIKELKNLIIKIHFKLHFSSVKRTRNSPTKLLLQCKSFDSEHDKLRDKQLSSMKCENALQNKDFRRKSDDYKHGVFKFRSSVDTTQLYSIKVNFSVERI